MFQLQMPENWKPDPKWFFSYQQPRDTPTISFIRQKQHFLGAKKMLRKSEDNRHEGEGRRAWAPGELVTPTLNPCAVNARASYSSPHSQGPEGRARTC